MTFYAERFHGYEQDKILISTFCCVVEKYCRGRLSTPQKAFLERLKEAPISQVNCQAECIHHKICFNGAIPVFLCLSQEKPEEGSDMMSDPFIINEEEEE